MDSSATVADVWELQDSLEVIRGNKQPTFPSQRGNNGRRLHLITSQRSRLHTARDIQQSPGFQHGVSSKVFSASDPSDSQWEVRLLLSPAEISRLSPYYNLIGLLCSFSQDSGKFFGKMEALLGGEGGAESRVSGWCLRFLCLSDEDKVRKFRTLLTEKLNGVIITSCRDLCGMEAAMVASGLTALLAAHLATSIGDPQVFNYRGEKGKSHIRHEKEIQGMVTAFGVQAEHFTVSHQKKAVHIIFRNPCPDNWVSGGRKHMDGIGTLELGQCHKVLSMSGAEYEVKFLQSLQETYDMTLSFHLAAFTQHLLMRRKWRQTLAAVLEDGRKEAVSELSRLAVTFLCSERRITEAFTQRFMEGIVEKRSKFEVSSVGGEVVEAFGLLVALLAALTVGRVLEYDEDDHIVPDASSTRSGESSHVLRTDDLPAPDANMTGGHHDEEGNVSSNIFIPSGVTPDSSNSHMAEGHHNEPGNKSPSTHGTGDLPFGVPPDSTNSHMAEGHHSEPGNKSPPTPRTGDLPSGGPPDSGNSHKPEGHHNERSNMSADLSSERTSNSNNSDMTEGYLEESSETSHVPSTTSGVPPDSGNSHMAEGHPDEPDNSSPPTHGTGDLPSGVPPDSSNSHMADGHPDEPGNSSPPTHGTGDLPFGVSPDSTNSHTAEGHHNDPGNKSPPTHGTGDLPSGVPPDYSNSHMAEGHQDEMFKKSPPTPRPGVLPFGVPPDSTNNLMAEGHHNEPSSVPSTADLPSWVTPGSSHSPIVEGHHDVLGNRPPSVPSTADLPSGVPPDSSNSHMAEGHHNEASSVPRTADLPSGGTPGSSHSPLVEGHHDALGNGPPSGPPGVPSAADLPSAVLNANKTEDVPGSMYRGEPGGVLEQLTFGTEAEVWSPEISDGCNSDDIGMPSLVDDSECSPKQSRNLEEINHRDVSGSSVGFPESSEPQKIITPEDCASDSTGSSCRPLPFSDAHPMAAGGGEPASERRAAIGQPGNTFLMTALILTIALAITSVIPTWLKLVVATIFFAVMLAVRRL